MTFRKTLDGAFRRINHYQGYLWYEEPRIEEKAKVASSPLSDVCEPTEGEVICPTRK